MCSRLTSIDVLLAIWINRLSIADGRGLKSPPLYFICGILNRDPSPKPETGETPIKMIKQMMKLIKNLCTQGSPGENEWNRFLVSREGTVCTPARMASLLTPCNVSWLGFELFRRASTSKRITLFRIILSHSPGFSNGPVRVGRIAFPPFTFLRVSR